MLPSMPILFTRDSQDAFGNKIEPSTSYIKQNLPINPVINLEPPVIKPLPDRDKETNTNNKNGTIGKAKVEQPKAKYSAIETELIRSYYTKVQSRFSSNTTQPANKFVQFQSILRSFNPYKETPEELYRKIEDLFGEEHKDIVEEFLLFLKPGQAAKVGRFMDRFMLVQIMGFIDLLQSTFARKPTVIRKILRAITTGLNTGSSQDTKTRVLPHLRSNARLTQMFKSLFPDERPPDSAYDSRDVDLLHESFLTSDKGYDVWELEEETDAKGKPDLKEGVDIVYLQGRVFLQHGRLLKSARVTYPYSKEPYRVHARRLAPAQSQTSPSNSDEERSPKRNCKNISKVPPKRAKKRIPSPTKGAKDVNDNTKLKDCAVMSPKACKRTSIAKSKKKDIDSKETKRDKKDKNNASQKETARKLTKIDNPICLEAKKGVKGNWTRDEDKTMLQVLKGEAGSEQIFCRINELLPHRTPTEIKERFCHVMTLLRQMSVGEVT